MSSSSIKASTITPGRPAKLQGSDQTTLRFTRPLCRWAVPGIWGYAAFITANNYLAAQKIVVPQMVTGSLVLMLHPAITWLCIYPLGKSR